MSANLIAVLLIFAGVLLIYGAKKDEDPRNIIFEALGIKRRVPNPAPVGAGKVVGEWHDPGTSYTNPSPSGGQIVSV